MKWRMSLVIGMVAAGLFLLTPGAARAGDRVHAGSGWSMTYHTRSTQPPTASVVRPVATRMTISITKATASAPAREPVYVTLRGPDGQTRRFAVEGGPAAIEPVQAVVLRPGQSVTIRWVSRK
jgi:hypothetical protein